MIIRFGCSLLTLFFILVTNCHAIDYPKGHQALEVFDAAGMQASPLWVMVWIMFMMTSFAIGIFFVRRHIVARWVVGGFVAGLIVLNITNALGILQLSGFIALLHIIFWSPALYQLLKQRPFITENKTAYTIWSGVITLVILFSFVFDIRDALIYLNHIF